MREETPTQNEESTDTPQLGCMTRITHYANYESVRYLELTVYHENTRLVTYMHTIFLYFSISKKR